MTASVSEVKVKSLDLQQSSENLLKFSEYENSLKYQEYQKAL